MNEKADSLLPEETQGELFFGDRFWEQYIGKKILGDPIFALVELVANCWDAGAKLVRIDWPDDFNGVISIEDNGEGMTEPEFKHRWFGMSYDRILNQGSTVEVEVDGRKMKRHVFGRNGIGRFAAFCFAPNYHVTTCKRGEQNIFQIRKGITQALEIKLISKTNNSETGTTVQVQQDSGSILPVETIRTELSRRFLIDPSFQVSVNGVLIDFEDIKDKGLEIIEVPIPGKSDAITIRIIDSKRTDRTVQQHGVAWHVLGRLVGDCDWKDPEQKSLIDGRRIEAKRFTFIVEADILRDSNAIKADWSGFDESNPDFQVVNTEIQKAITKRLLDATREKRIEITQNVRKSFRAQIKELSPLKREKWISFVDKITEECPSLTEHELKSVSGVLANMELASSQYSLLHKLHSLDPNQIDELHNILAEWTVDMAKIVLDEIRGRIKLIEELRIKTQDNNTLEVQELQPLFRQGLWIFGPEFETIHYTSNKGMTTVIQEIFGDKIIKGSLNRPDFVILPDSSVGFYSYPEYDDDGGELGARKVVVVELKAPDVPLGDDEKNQCWKYIRELNEKGLLNDRTQVQGFVLGKTVKPSDRTERTELDGRVKILPLPFSVVLERADSRLLQLREKIKSAPFMQDANLSNFDDEEILEENSLEKLTETSV